jgi:hypothetical protein
MRRSSAPAVAPLAPAVAAGLACRSACDGQEPLLQPALPRGRRRGRRRRRHARVAVGARAQRVGGPHRAHGAAVRLSTAAAAVRNRRLSTACSGSRSPAQPAAAWARRWRGAACRRCIAWFSSSSLVAAGGTGGEQEEGRAGERDCRSCSGLSYACNSLLKPVAENQIWSLSSSCVSDQRLGGKLEQTSTLCPTLLLLMCCS